MVDYMYCADVCVLGATKFKMESETLPGQHSNLGCIRSLSLMKVT